MRNKLILILSATIFLCISGIYIYKNLIVPRNKDFKTFQVVRELTDSNKIASGDIIFQTSLSSQSKAIQLATHSKYSHCGIVFWDNGECFVWEASNVVTMTPLEKFIQKGQGEHFVIKRLRDGSKFLSSAEYMQKFSDLFYNKFLNKPYDIYFGWSDEKIYCSELVWKLYKESFGIEVGKLQKLSDFDLTNEIVKKKMEERYGNKIPLNETVISPESIFKSNLLLTTIEK